MARARLCCATDGQGPALTSRRVRTLSDAGLNGHSVAARVLALFPRRISAECRVKISDAIVILNCAQFVFFAQFQRHQPCPPPKLGAVPLDVRDELINTRAFIVRTDLLRTVSDVGAERSQVRRFSSVKIAPLNVIGKRKKRELYLPLQHVGVFPRFSTVSAIYRRLTLMDEILECYGHGQCCV